MENLNIKYHGFNPSNFTKDYLLNKLQHILDESPYNALVNAVFSRDQNGFKATVRINTPVGKFFAMSSSSKLKDVTSKVIEQLRKQLSKWKSKRFQAVRNSGGVDYEEQYEQQIS